VSELDLLVVGDVNADLVLRGGDLVPSFGQREQLVDSASLVLGGSGAIVAAGAARLGLRVAMAGCVGDDVLGRAMLEALAGVDVSAVRLAAEPTGITVAEALGTATSVHAKTNAADIRDAVIDPPQMVSLSLRARYHHFRVECQPRNRMAPTWGTTEATAKLT